MAEADPELAVPQPPAIDPSHLVIYFDQLHLKPAGRNRLIDDLRDFLAAERVPAERVLIYDDNAAHPGLSAAEFVVGSGSANLADETWDLWFKPKPKRFALNAAVPVHMTGPFHEPDIEVQKIGILRKIGALQQEPAL